MPPPADPSPNNEPAENHEEADPVTASEPENQVIQAVEPGSGEDTSGAKSLDSSEPTKLYVVIGLSTAAFAVILRVIIRAKKKKSEESILRFH